MGSLLRWLEDDCCCGEEGEFLAVSSLCVWMNECVLYLLDAGRWICLFFKCSDEIRRC